MRRFALAKVAALVVGKGKTEDKRKTVFYGTSVNTCLSFLNSSKKRSGIEKPKSTGVSDGKQTVFTASLKNDGSGELRFSTALNTCIVILERSDGK